VGRTKLHTEAAGFAALDDNRNTSFCHGISTLKVVEDNHESRVIMPCRGYICCDNDHRCL
jgi:hypothetical protein